MDSAFPKPWKMGSGLGRNLQVSGMPSYPVVHLCPPTPFTAPVAVVGQGAGMPVRPGPPPTVPRPFFSGATLSMPHHPGSGSFSSTAPPPQAPEPRDTNQQHRSRSRVRRIVGYMGPRPLWLLEGGSRAARRVPHTGPAQCAPLDLNPGSAQLSVHRWTATHRWTSTRDLPSSVCTAGLQRSDRFLEEMPDMPDKMP